MIQSLRLTNRFTPYFFAFLIGWHTPLWGQAEEAAKCEVKPAPVEGQQKISGTVGSEAARVNVTVSNPKPKKMVHEVSATLISANQFSVSTPALKAGQIIDVQEVKADGSNAKKCAATVAPRCVINPAIEGDTNIVGQATPDAEKVKLTVMRGISELVVYETTAGVGSDKKFTIPVPALKPGQLVRVQGLKSVADAQGAKTDQPAGASCEIAVIQQCVINPAKEGDTSVSGKAGAKAAKVVLRIERGGSLVEMADESFDAEKKTFTATVKPLAVGQDVVLQGFTSAGVAAGKCSVPVETAEYSWGRVRATFNGGVILSKENNEFSEQDLYASFNLDKTWLGLGKTPEKQKKGFLINSFFDVRLTALPVTSIDPAKKDNGGTGNGGGNGGGSGNGGETGNNGTGSSLNAAPGQFQDAPATPKRVTSQMDNLLASRKAALFQAGLYLPLYPEAFTWDYLGRKNALFLAPLAKAGFQTLTSEDAAAGQSQVEAVADDVSNFFGFGARIGHYQLSGNNDESHQLISYLDIVMGRWENFDLKEEFEVEGAPNIVELTRPWRLGLEGRLKIPLSPFSIGFDANLGDGRDDIRFIFGTRFDIGKLFGKLQSLQGQ